VKLLGADESLRRKSQAQGSLLLFTGVDNFSTPVNVWIICALQFTDIKYRNEDDSGNNLHHIYLSLSKNILCGLRFEQSQHWISGKDNQIFKDIYAGKQFLKIKSPTPDEAHKWYLSASVWKEAHFQLARSPYSSNTRHWEA
jgi:hypothetical protein